MVSSVASALSTIVRSASAASFLMIPFTVKATSEAVRGSPSVNFTSLRMWKVQVRPSSELS